MYPLSSGFQYAVIASLGLFAASTTVHAADVPFFKDKTVTIIVSTGEGGTYSLNARMVSRYMPHYLPGEPKMIAQNMPGGGHMLATNYLYNVAPKDGTAIGTVNQNVPSHQVLDGKGVRYDAAKFNWLGGLGSGNTVVAVWHTAGVKSFDDLMTREVTTGATGDGSSAYTYPQVMNKVLGTKFKIIKGYKSIPEVQIAMERGEVATRVGGYSSYKVDKTEWITEKKVTFPLQIGAKREHDLPDVPLWTEVAKTDEQRQILQLVAAPISLGRPFMAPPGLPDERVALLRKALAATFADKGFLEESAKQNLEIDVMSAEEVTKIVLDTLSASPEVIAKAKAAMDPLATP